MSYWRSGRQTSSRRQKNKARGGTTIKKRAVVWRRLSKEAKEGNRKDAVLLGGECGTGRKSENRFKGRG